MRQARRSPSAKILSDTFGVMLRSFIVETVGDRTDVEIKPVPMQGRQASVALIDEASGADLLVVGSRGEGGFSGLLLGSVSQQCSHHAQCPLVVVRDG